MSETQIIDMLFLELSQFTKATTAKELRLRAERDEARAAIERLQVDVAQEANRADAMQKSAQDNYEKLKRAEGQCDTAKAQVRAHRARLAVANPGAARLRARYDEAVALLREIDEWFRQEGSFPDYIQARLDAFLAGGQP